MGAEGLSPDRIQRRTALNCDDFATLLDCSQTLILPHIRACLVARLCQVDGEPLKISERAVSQSTLMGGAQNDPWRLVCF